MWQRMMEAEINAVVSIREDPDLRQAWLEGVPLHSAAAEAEAAKIVRTLEQKRGCFTDECPVQLAPKT